MSLSSRTQTELAQVSTCKSEVQLKCILYIVFERDHLVSFLRNSNQHQTEIEQNISAINVEKRVLVATVDLQASEIKSLNRRKRFP